MTGLNHELLGTFNQASPALHNKSEIRANIRNQHSPMAIWKTLLHYQALSGEILTAAQTAAARNFINEISGSTRMFAHGLLYVGKGNLEYIQQLLNPRGRRLAIRRTFRKRRRIGPT